MRTRSKSKDHEPGKTSRNTRPFPQPPDPPAERKHKLVERDGRWTVVYVEDGSEVEYSRQSDQEKIEVYRRNLDALLPTPEPKARTTRPAKQPAIASTPSEASIQTEPVELEEVEILLTPAQPAKFSPPSISKERYWEAITNRLQLLVVLEIQDGYGRDYTRTDALRRELNDIQSQTSHACPNWNVFNDARCHKIKLQQDPLLWPRVVADIAGVPEYDQRRLRYDIETRIRQHELGYSKVDGQVLDLLRCALIAIDMEKEILPKHYNLAAPPPLTPDVPATLLQPARPPVIRTIKVRKERKVSTTAIGQRERALEILNGSPTSFKEVSDLCAYYVLKTLGLSEGQEERLRLICHELGERRRSATQVQDTKIKSMMTDTRLSNGKVVYLDPWCLHELTDLAVQAKRLIESCPRHKPDDQGKCEDPSCFWKARHGVLNWIEAHRSNDAAVLAGEDLYDAALRYSRDWKPPQKESSKVDLLMERMGETLDRIPEWLGRRGVRKTR